MRLLDTFESLLTVFSREMVQFSAPRVTSWSFISAVLFWEMRRLIKLRLGEIAKVQTLNNLNAICIFHTSRVYHIQVKYGLVLFLPKFFPSGGFFEKVMKISTALLSLTSLSAVYKPLRCVLSLGFFISCSIFKRS